MNNGGTFVNQLQEFKTLEHLEEAARRLRMTPIVDDDYPEMRKNYEYRLGEFLKACRTNGRLK